MWKIGHRGACGYAPENTLLSMRKALEMGLHGFEFDIQMSKDHVPVVIHDDNLRRTTNGQGKIDELTFKELQQFDAGQGERIPSLSEVFDLVDRRCRLFIELKASHCTQAVLDVIEHYIQKQGWNSEQCIVCSFDHIQLLDLHQLNPGIRTCALMAGIPVSLAEVAQQAHAWAFNPCIEHINQALVDDAHKRDLKVFTWTANEPHQIAKAKSLGVDGVISNFPDRI